MYVVLSKGGYHLQSSYNDAKKDPSFLTLLRAFSPDEAVKRMKDFVLQQGKRPNGEEDGAVLVREDDPSDSRYQNDTAVDSELTREEFPQTTPHGGSPSNSTADSRRYAACTNQARANL